MSGAGAWWRKLPWRCEVCGLPIKPKAGYIEIVDRPLSGLPGGYPRRHTEDEAELVELQREPGSELRAVRLADLPPDPPPRIAFRVVHGECDPDPDRQGYTIGVERACNLSRWVGWTLHVGEKGWMGRRDVLAMLWLWYSNRDLPRSLL